MSARLTVADAQVILDRWSKRRTALHCVAEGANWSGNGSGSLAISSQGVSFVGGGFELRLPIEGKDVVLESHDAGVPATGIGPQVSSLTVRLPNGDVFHLIVRDGEASSATPRS